MTNEEAIKVIQTEIECVKSKDCMHPQCSTCRLAMEEADVLTAYEMAIIAIENCEK